MRRKIAQVQFRPRKARVEANLERIADAIAAAADEGAELVCFPETALTGYFLMGGVQEVAQPAERVAERLAEVVEEARPGTSVEVSLGFYEQAAGEIYNSVLHARLGSEGPRVLHVHRKVFLPSYGVFDEGRYVSRGRSVEGYDSILGRSATLICEDAWHSISSTIAALEGATVILIASASPARGLDSEMPRNVRRWRSICSRIAEEHGCWVARTDLVGFEGGKGFAGSSTLHAPSGELRMEGPLLEEALLVSEVDSEEVVAERVRLPLAADLIESVALLSAQIARAR